MKKKIIFAIILIMLVGLVGCDKKEEPKLDSKNFDVEFLKMENSTKNTIYSPLSIKYALNMLNEGAFGETKEEIEIVIKNLKLTKYESIDKNLSFANALYVRDTYKDWVKEEFANTLKSKYNAEVRFDSFNDAKNVNKFIEEKTLGIIKDMLRDEVVQDKNLKLILINALAIDMEWKYKFQDEDTTGKEFTLVDGSKINATTMRKSNVKSEDVSFYKDSKITALSMDLKKYADVELEFIAIMPKEPLNEYVKNFKTEEFDTIKSKSTLASKTQNGVNISIPKFKYEYDLKLKEDLKTLGIVKAFNSMEADFTNMTNNPRGLYVSDALHKANIEFSEEGIKAAAVTVFLMSDRAISIHEAPEEIIIDNPFLYVIRDKASGEIWFVGTVYEPNLWENDRAAYQS